MKKLLAVILTLAFALGLTACGSGDGGSSDGEVSVFYYTYSDTYISSVRSAMDKFLKDAGLKFQNYDANGNQTTQTEQVTTALAKGSKLLVVNVVDTGSNDAAQNIIDQANRLHGAQRLVINTNRTRVVDQLIEFLHHQHVNAHLAEIVRHHQPDRTGTSDRHLNAMVNSRLDVRVLYCHFSTSRLGQNAVARTVQRNLFC